MTRRIVKMKSLLKWSIYHFGHEVGCGMLDMTQSKGRGGIKDYLKADFLRVITMRFIPSDQRLRMFLRRSPL